MAPFALPLFRMLKVRGTVELLSESEPPEPAHADVDVAMLAGDYARLQGLIQGQLPDGLWFQDRSTDKCILLASKAGCLLLFSLTNATWKSSLPTPGQGHQGRLISGLL